MKKFLILALAIVSLASLPSCSRYASEKNFDAISLHMTKEEVIKKMDCQGLARGSIINKYGQTIEVREYVTRDWFASAWEEYKQTYWLYFCDGKLVQRGRAGDWAETQRMIYDINFNASSNS